MPPGSEQPALSKEDSLKGVGPVLPDWVKSSHRGILILNVSRIWCSGPGLKPRPILLAQSRALPPRINPCQSLLPRAAILHRTKISGPALASSGVFPSRRVTRRTAAPFKGTGYAVNELGMDPFFQLHDWKPGPHG